MAELIKSVKALGEAITGEKIEGDTLFEAVKDAGEKMTGKELEGKELNDIIAETADAYEGGGAYITLPIDSKGKHAKPTPLTYLHFYVDDEEVQFVGNDFTGFLYVPESVLTQDNPNFTVRLDPEIGEPDDYQLSVHAFFEVAEDDPYVNISEVNVDYSFIITSGFYHFVTFGRA